MLCLTSTIVFIKKKRIHICIYPWRCLSYACLYYVTNYAVFLVSSYLIDVKKRCECYKALLSSVAVSAMWCFCVMLLCNVVVRRVMDVLYMCTCILWSLTLMLLCILVVLWITVSKWSLILCLKKTERRIINVLHLVTLHSFVPHRQNDLYFFPEPYVLTSDKY